MSNTATLRAVENRYSPGLRYNIGLYNALQVSSPEFAPESLGRAQMMEAFMLSNDKYVS